METRNESTDRTKSNIDSSIENWSFIDIKTYSKIQYKYIALVVDNEYDRVGLGEVWKIKKGSRNILFFLLEEDMSLVDAVVFFFVSFPSTSVVLVFC